MSARTSGRFSVPPQPPKRVRPTAGSTARARTQQSVSTLKGCEGSVNICRQQSSTTERLITLRGRNDASQTQAHGDHDSRDPAALRSPVSRGAQGLLELPPASRRNDDQARSRLDTPG